MHKFIPNAPSDVNSGCESSSGLKWEKLETIPAWQLDKVKNKKEVILEAQRDKKKVHFATWMDICHLKKCGVRTKAEKVQRKRRAPTL